MTHVPQDENRITYFGETDARNRRAKFGIKAKDRTKHVYVIGKTGMGKSTLLENMAVQDIQNGEGMCFIDPHGKTADLLLEYVPKERINDVVYIAPFDTDHPISFNVLESVDPTKRHLVVSGLMSTFKKIWVDAWSARMEYILTNTLLALLEAPGTTLLGVNRMLSDKEYRKEIVSQVEDPSVKTFWTKEFANYTERMAAEAVPAIQNKVGQFTANPLIRNMIGQPVSSFDFRQAMDSRKIMIINLSKGKIGDDNMKLLGGLLVTKIYLAAMSRADIPDRVMKVMPNFYLFVDEFQNFANASFADILSEARKYKLNLTIAHQYVEQMDEVVRPAVFGNVGTMIVFRVGATDAELLEKEFAPQFTIEDLVSLGFTQIYLKLMIDGLTSPPFSAVTLPPIPHPDISYVKEIIDASRSQFAKPRAEVEKEIIRFHEPVQPKQRVDNKISDASSGLGVGQSQRPSVSKAVREEHVPLSQPVLSKTQANNDKVRNVQGKGEYVHRPKLSEDAKASESEVRLQQKATPVAGRVRTPPSRDESRPINSSRVVQQVRGSTSSPKPQLPLNVSVEVSKPKPVSLSNLSSKQSFQKQDPKIPTKQNVNELKNALAMALNKDKGQNKSLENKPVNANDNLKPIPKIGESKDGQKEVPEQVLKDVLKM